MQASFEIENIFRPDTAWYLRMLYYHHTVHSTLFRAICTPSGQQLPHYPWLSYLSRAAISFVFSCGYLTYTFCFYLYKMIIIVWVKKLHLRHFTFCKYIVGHHAEIYKSCVTRVAWLGFYGDIMQLRYILKINK